MQAIELEFYQGEDSFSEEFNLYDLIRRINPNPLRIIINQNDEEEVGDGNSVIKVEPEFFAIEGLTKEFRIEVIANFNPDSVEPCYMYVE